MASRPLPHPSFRHAISSAFRKALHPPAAASDVLHFSEVIDDEFDVPTSSMTTTPTPTSLVPEHDFGTMLAEIQAPAQSLLAMIAGSPELGLASVPQLRTMANAALWDSVPAHIVATERALYSLGSSCNGDCCMYHAHGQSAFLNCACRIGTQRMHAHMPVTISMVGNRYNGNSVVTGAFHCNLGACNAEKQFHAAMRNTKSVSPRVFGHATDTPMVIHYLFLATALALTALGRTDSNVFNTVVMTSQIGDMTKPKTATVSWSKMLHFDGLRGAFTASMVAEFRHMFPDSDADDPSAALFRLIHVLQLSRVQLGRHEASVTDENALCFIPKYAFDVLHAAIATALAAVAEDVPGALAALSF